MRISDLLSLMEESGLSPENFGKRLGISGMTIRRFLEKKTSAPLPDLYARSLRDVTLSLLIEGRLKADSKTVDRILGSVAPLDFEASIQRLGANAWSGVQSKSDQGVLVGLAQIGADERKRDEVLRKKSKIAGFKKLGKEWGDRISTLLSAIASRDTATLEKFVAFGALFYLITPFDLIPDQIPVIGLIDDFGVLGFATAYYSKRALR